MCRTLSAWLEGRTMDVHDTCQHIKLNELNHVILPERWLTVWYLEGRGYAVLAVLNPIKHLQDALHLLKELIQKLLISESQITDSPYGLVVRVPGCKV
jgi:hypothetical protein